MPPANGQDGRRVDGARRCHRDPLCLVLMPAINRATDTVQKRRFKALHTLSVGITLGPIVIAA